MSADSEGAAPGRRTRRQTSRFRHALIGSMAALAVGAAALTGVAAAQGPGIRSVDLNADALSSLPAQRIVLTADQPLSRSAADGVTLEPAAPVTAAVVDGRLEVTVGEPLRYATEYTLTVPALISRDTGNSASAEHIFSTPDPDVYTLNRDLRTDADGEDADDVVLRQSMSGTDAPEIVAAAPRIEEYAVVADVTAVSVLEPDGSSTVILSDSAGRTRELPLGPGAVVRQLSGSGRSGLLGFTFSGLIRGVSWQNVLMIHDPRAASGLPLAARGIDGAPLRVADWMFVPGTASIVAQGPDQSLYLVDALTGEVATPLGRHTELRGFVPGTVRLVVSDPDGYAVLDLAGGSADPLPLPEPAAVGAYPGQRMVLDDSGAFAQVFTTPVEGAGPGVFSAVLAVTDAGGTRVVYRPAVEDTRIRDFCISPNGRYAAVETAPGGAELDGYRGVAAYTGMTTVFVELETGEVTRTAYGFLPSWCR